MRLEAACLQKRGQNALAIPNAVICHETRSPGLKGLRNCACWPRASLGVRRKAGSATHYCYLGSDVNKCRRQKNGQRSTLKAERQWVWVCSGANFEHKGTKENASRLYCVLSTVYCFPDYSIEPIKRNHIGLFCELVG